jgi:multiple sugar transport system substrate-binding protein
MAQFFKRRSLLFILYFLLFTFFFSGCTVIRRLPLPFLSKSTEKSREATLTYWGLWEPEQVLRPIIEEYQKNNPHITIEYQRQAPAQYRDRVQARLKTGKGPDIFDFHNTWLPMLADDLIPLPSTIMSSADFEKTYYPVTRSDLKIGNSYYGIPLEFDGLALFYNEELFKKAGILTPPTTWDELREIAAKLVVRDEETGELEAAGIAMGTTGNVDHFSDILALMLLQNGVKLSNMTGNLAEDALSFYTIFYSEDKIWDEEMPTSTEAFANGRLAMTFGPSWRVFNIKALAPELRFKTAPVPQLPGGTVNWASYWVVGVAKKSQFQAEAWDFLKFLSQKETLRKLYAGASKIRLFGRPYPRKDMADSLINEEYVGAYIAAAPTAQSWYLASRTFDNGINDRIIKYLEDAINSKNQGKSAKDALDTAVKGISGILTQFKVVIEGT